MLIGSGVSVFVSVAAFKLYSTAWEVPGPEFPAPTAMIWLDMAALVNGGSVAPHIIPFCIAAAVCAAALPALAFMLQRMSQPAEGAAPNKRAELAARIQHFLPSGIGFAVCNCHRHHSSTLPVVCCHGMKR